MISFLFALVILGAVLYLVETVQHAIGRGCSESPVCSFRSGGGSLEGLAAIHSATVRSFLDELQDLQALTRFSGTVSPPCFSGVW